MMKFVKFYFLVAFYLVSLNLVLISCQEKKSTQKIKFWYSYQNHQDRNFTSDTFEINKIKQHIEDDSFIASKGFTYKGKGYGISMFTNEPGAPVDGGVIYYELNHLGIIYSRSTSWISYGVLRSENDSINDLINVAIQNILLHEDLRCFDVTSLYKYKYKKEGNTFPSLEGGQGREHD